MRTQLPLLLIVSLFLTSPLKAAWTMNGVQLSGAPGNQYSVGAISDGAGGAFAAWMDDRSDNQDIYAGRMGADGVPQWTLDGVAVCTAAGFRSRPGLIRDGADGVILFWSDSRSGTSDIFAQRLDANGNPLWTTNGVQVAPFEGDETFMRATTDGAGGIIVIWADRRFHAYTELRAQRLDPDGNLLWVSDGVPIVANNASQALAQTSILSDGVGGAFVAWHDIRGGSGIYGVRTQRIDATGALLWGNDGIPIYPSANSQGSTRLIADDAGGAFLVWTENRNGVSLPYLQRLDANGNKLLDPPGVAIANTYLVSVFSDKVGGLFVYWDSADGGGAQRLDATGQPLWTTPAVEVFSSPDKKFKDRVAADGLGGLYVVWDDFRTGQQTDLFAQWVDSNGVPQWGTAGAAVCALPRYQGSGTIVPDGQGGALVGWHDRRIGPEDEDVYFSRIGGVTTAVQPSASRASLISNAPNPFSQATQLRFWLPESTDIAIDVFDIAGRRVSQLGSRPGVQGWNDVRLAGRNDAGQRLPSGVYFYRVQAGDQVLQRKMTIRH